MAVTNTLNWTVVRGDDWTRTFTIRDETNAVPDGLATATITCTIRDQYDTVVLSGTTTAGDITASGTTGEVVVHLDDGDTDDLAPGEYDYDIEIVSSSGVRLTPVLGTLTVRNDVTRS